MFPMRVCYHFLKLLTNHRVMLQILAFLFGRFGGERVGIKLFGTFSKTDDGSLHLSRLFSVNISTTDQRCFNVVDQRWNNVDPKLKMKQNMTSDFQLSTTLIQRQCSTLKQRRSNVAQHWYNVASMLLQRSFGFLNWNYKAIFL